MKSSEFAKKPDLSQEQAEAYLVGEQMRRLGKDWTAKNIMEALGSVGVRSGKLLAALRYGFIYDNEEYDFDLDFSVLYTPPVSPEYSREKRVLDLVVLERIIQEFFNSFDPQKELDAQTLRRIFSQAVKDLV